MYFSLRFSVEGWLFQREKSEEARYTQEKGLCGFGYGEGREAASFQYKENPRFKSIDHKAARKVRPAQRETLNPGEFLHRSR